MGTTTATVTAGYYRAMPSGANWPADAGNVSFSLAPNGGQKVVRQYNDATMTSGRGSAVITSTEPVAALVQILARNPPNPAGTYPSSGAYASISQPSGTYYAPLLFHQLTNSYGQVNSQIAIQNVGSTATNVSVQFIGASSYTSPTINILPGATFYYDMDGENNLPTPWNGSAVIAAGGGGQIAVVVNIFTGPDILQTYNAFPQESVGTTWLFPLASSRLANGQSTTITAQNLSGGTMMTGTLSLNCTHDPTSANVSDFTKTNTAWILNNNSYTFNPVTDMTFPDNWFGSCNMVAPGNVVAFVQIRRLSSTLGAAYEGIKGSSTDKKVIFPLVSHHLANGQGMVAYVQNVSTSQPASVSLTFTPSPDYVASGGSSALITWSGSIAASSSLYINMRNTGNLTIGGSTVVMPDGWYGSLTAVSSDRPIHGMVQITNWSASITAGDTLQALLGFTQP